MPSDALSACYAYSISSRGLTPSHATHSHAYLGIQGMDVQDWLRLNGPLPPFPPFVSRYTYDVRLRACLSKRAGALAQLHGYELGTEVGSQVWPESGWVDCLAGPLWLIGHRVLVC